VIYSGLAGQIIRFRLGPNDEFDPSTASAPFLVVQSPQGVRSEFAATISAQSALEVTIDYETLSTDIVGAGAWHAYIRCTAGGSTRRSETVVMQVLGEFG
jgi:hypothetical protein